MVNAYVKRPTPTVVNRHNHNLMRVSDSLMTSLTQSLPSHFYVTGTAYVNTHRGNMLILELSKLLSFLYLHCHSRAQTAKSQTRWHLDSRLGCDG